MPDFHCFCISMFHYVRIPMSRPNAISRTMPSWLFQFWKGTNKLYSGKQLLVLIGTVPTDLTGNVLLDAWGRLTGMLKDSIFRILMAHKSLTITVKVFYITHVNHSFVMSCFIGKVAGYCLVGSAIQKGQGVLIIPCKGKKKVVLVPLRLFSSKSSTTELLWFLLGYGYWAQKTLAWNNVLF